jgi:hypothetical protein
MSQQLQYTEVPLHRFFSDLVEQGVGLTGSKWGERIKHQLAGQAGQSSELNGCCTRAQSQWVPSGRRRRIGDRKEKSKKNKKN